MQYDIHKNFNYYATDIVLYILLVWMWLTWRKHLRTLHFVHQLNS